jgi:NAD(P)-dependent dehydrogenase (short-subunit alcohol dehydrogenase family)
MLSECSADASQQNDVSERGCITMPENVFHGGEPVAMVVGCGGLGTSVARALGRRHPLLIVDIDARRLGEVVAGLALEGYAVSGEVCDITDPALTAALGARLESGPGVRVLAQVAAVGKSIGSWRKMVEIDFIGARLVADAVGPHMVRGGAAILISSLASYLPPNKPAIDSVLREPLASGFFERLADAIGYEPDAEEAYNYAKLGINLLAEQLAIEWGPRGVRAVSLSPGMIDSPMARAEGDTLPSHDGTNSRKTRADKAREIPLGREGSILEITNVVDFLASDGASFINGIDLTVDGGHRARWRSQGVIGR